MRDCDRCGEFGDETENGCGTNWTRLRTDDSSVRREYFPVSEANFLGRCGCCRVFYAEHHILVVLAAGGLQHGFHLVFYRDFVAREWSADFGSWPVRVLASARS